MFTVWLTYQMGKEFNPRLDKTLHDLASKHDGSFNGAGSGVGRGYDGIRDIDFDFGTLTTAHAFIADLPQDVSVSYCEEGHYE